MSSDEENTIVCRCEDMTLKAIRDLIAHGFKTIDELKRISKCGMGPCQGGTCRQIVMREVARATGKDIREVEVSTFRPRAEKMKLGLSLWIRQRNNFPPLTTKQRRSTIPPNPHLVFPRRPVQTTLE